MFLETNSLGLVDSKAFGLFVFFSIGLHALFSAADVDCRADPKQICEAGPGESSFTDFVAYFFLVIYSIESALRLVAYGRLYFLDPYCMADLMLILIDVVDLFFFQTGGHILLFRILRSMRLLRLLRSLRMFRQLRMLWNSFIAGMVSRARSLRETGSS